MNGLPRSADVRAVPNQYSRQAPTYEDVATVAADLPFPLHMICHINGWSLLRCIESIFRQVPGHTDRDDVRGVLAQSIRRHARTDKFESSFRIR